MLLRGNSNARILHIKYDPAPLKRPLLLCKGSDIERDKSIHRKLNRIGEQVAENLLHTLRIGMYDLRHLTVERNREFQPLKLGCNTELHSQQLRNFTYIQIFFINIKLTGFYFGQVENVVDKHQQVLARAVNNSRIFLRLLPAQGIIIFFY
ncbi:hypothetical protein D3C80_1546290 [compost metagenome]